MNKPIEMYLRLSQPAYTFTTACSLHLSAMLVKFKNNEFIYSWKGGFHY